MIIRHKPIEYGHWAWRFLAVLIDTIILFPANMLIAALFYDHPFIAVLTNLLVSGFYVAYFLNGNWQATPGKRIVGVYVVNDDGSPLTQRQAIERYLAYIMPSLPLYSSLDPGSVHLLMLWLMLVWFLPIILTKQKTGMHDLLCHTRVLMGRTDRRN